MRRAPWVAALLVISGTVGAQVSSDDSTRLVDILVEAQWQNVEQMKPIVVANLRQSMQAKGMSANMARIFSEEYDKAFSKNALKESIRRYVEKVFSSQEISDLVVFFASPTGQKYMAVFLNMANRTALAIPVLEQACANTRPRLSDPERSALGRICHEVDQQSAVVQSDLDELGKLDGTWEGPLYTFERNVATSSPMHMRDKPREVRLVIRGIPVEVRTKTSEGEWRPPTVGFFEGFRYERSAETIVGSFLRSGRNPDQWVEHQSLYITRKDANTLIVYWVRAVNNVEAPLSDPQSKWGRVGVGELRKAH